jgi:capsular polysaccharide biosynthesis protein
VNCAANAKVLCGLHGAGFTNMMFAHSRQKIIEIMSPARDQIHYMLLAHKMGHVHFSDESVEEVAGTSECDYLIDPQHFSFFVRQCLEKK